MVRRVIGAAICLVALVAGGTPYAAAEREVASTCAGRAVTISWQPGVPTINGTGGPDVIQGGPRDETINAGGGEDVVCGGGGSDTIDGGSRRDELFGQDGGDDFVGAGLAQDLITGGSGGLDAAHYASLPAGVEVNLGTGLVHMTGAGVNGGILGVEIVLGSVHDDRLIGGAAREDLVGKAGNDTVEGRGGIDVLDGSGGEDTVTYAASNAAVHLDLATDRATVGTTEDRIQRFETAIGTRFDDRLLGAGDTNDHLLGAGGDDVLKGRAGDDLLDGGGDDDVIHPGPGDDEVDGGNNDPVTSSGEHGDLVSYQGDTATPHDGRNGFDAWLLPGFIGTPPGSDGVGHDEFSGVESIRGVKRGQNHLDGDAGPNVLIGGDGQDWFVGAGGNDLVFGLAGVDQLEGDSTDPAGGTFGDDYLDAGGPTGENDGDYIEGHGGNDTCTGAKPEWTENCETQF